MLDNIKQTTYTKNEGNFNMIYKPNYLRERRKQLISARNWGISVITGLLGLGLFAVVAGVRLPRNI